MLSQTALFIRYARHLRGFLSGSLTREDCQRALERQLRRREESFLAIVGRGVFGRAGSPYLPLLSSAGVDHAVLEGMVRSSGIEGALERLHDAGVHITLEEFKGRRPIERPGLTVPVQHTDFDNPLRSGHFEGRTGGSRGRPRRLLVDLDLLAQDAAAYGVFLAAWGAADRPMGVWRPVPPDNSGIKKLLMRAKLGTSVERWFSQVPNTLRPGSARYHLFTAYTRRVFRAHGHDFPVPEHSPIGDAATVARWLAEHAAAGRPAHLDTLVSCAVRACMEAQAEGLDIAGTFFRVGGEPLTPAKARVIAEAGARFAGQYSMSELGPVAMGCADGIAVDDMHLREDKVAAIQRERGGVTNALFLTTVLDSCPKLMLNVEVGDCGILETRTCGCLLGAAGLGRHLRELRSYEKLTSEGVTFLGTDLHDLLEVKLPAAFGGNPTDYQFVEEERDGLSRVSLRVSPRVGELDETRLRRFVLDTLGSRDVGHRLMSRMWLDGDALRVERREPLSTGAGKILPLHVAHGE